MNDGTDANDLATVLAKTYTGGNDVISLQSCYHGHSSALMGLTATNIYRMPIAVPSGFHHVSCDSVLCRMLCNVFLRPRRTDMLATTLLSKSVLSYEVAKFGENKMLFIWEHGAKLLELSKAHITNKTEGFVLNGTCIYIYVEGYNCLMEKDYYWIVTA